ncbi:MAG TPA: UbiA family prenyltransferase [Candidatus Sulfotelmatobacter sp.]|nr:UbiA family prenyltransferase [Candidatus Sulfotelmatobacter sp.]
MTRDVALPRWIHAVRVVHPFPSLLNAVAVAAFVILAGGTPAAAAALGAAMFLLQASIGAANDVVDLGADRLAKPGKPIAAGRVARRTAVALAAAAGAAGLVAAAAFGPAVLVVAVAGYGLGLAYDLRLKRSPWSWLAYALALPLVPTFAWLGAGAGLPPRFAPLIGLALLAGTALAVANGLVDLEGDAATGSTGVAGRLGRRRSLLLVTACEAGLVAVAGSTMVVTGTRSALPWLALAGSAILFVAGATLSADATMWRRRLGWETQAASVALLAVGWFALPAGG